MTFRLILPAVGALTLLLQGSPPFPSKPVRIVEPFGAGGGVDTIARLLSRELSDMWHQPVTVDNRPGEGSTAAPAFVAKSAADGYTLLANSSAQAYSASLKNLPYDPLRDFVPVAPLTRQAYVLVASESSGIGSVGELVALAKRQPGELKFGSPGIGTGSHVGAIRFNEAAEITAVHVPARPTDGIVGTIAETVSGRTTYLVAPIPLALSDILAGRLRALGVTTRTRSPLLPNVPSLHEAGLTGFDYAIWYGVWAPAGTTGAVVDKLTHDIARARDARLTRIAREVRRGADDHVTPRICALRDRREPERGACCQGGGWRSPVTQPFLARERPYGRPSYLRHREESRDE